MPVSRCTLSRRFRLIGHPKLLDGKAVRVSLNVWVLAFSVSVVFRESLIEWFGQVPRGFLPEHSIALRDPVVLLPGQLKTWLVRVRENVNLIIGPLISGGEAGFSCLYLLLRVIMCAV